ncbi:MAG TPA: hypothetical protein DDX39_10180 [Bacteroidales bacterium]|nr:MAG: hypothetical protein A2W98_04415 [Bacteroidetes bacterium GWF2_33_38]OFY88621.1 MAG: hypothetical protein A2236_11520 [Bacteroidetes bacterium RIFOXYA2_FULL_33_7]HBF88996.1 hypothetical protein [Bacteroidales bacterium]
MEEFDNPEKHITSVAKFLEIKHKLLNTSDINSGKWMFRGVKRYEYGLIPSIGRLTQKQNKIFKSKQKLFEFEKSAFAEFCINVYNDLRENNQFNLLAVAQHHGLKTRLLDWTLFPLVALFFAVEDKDCFEQDAALYAFQTQFVFNDFKKLTTPFHEDLDEYHFLFAPDLTQRIKAQQGVFQLFKDPTKEFTEGYNLMKFRIPSKNKIEIKRDLNDLGISYKTVYPDFDGLCWTINYNKLCIDQAK